MISTWWQTKVLFTVAHHHQLHLALFGEHCFVAHPDAPGTWWDTGRSGRWTFSRPSLWSWGHGGTRDDTIWQPPFEVIRRITGQVYRGCTTLQLQKKSVNASRNMWKKNLEFSVWEVFFLFWAMCFFYVSSGVFWFRSCLGNWFILAETRCFHAVFVDCAGLAASLRNNA